MTMNALEVTEKPGGRLGLFGLYAIIVYCLAVIALWLFETIPHDSLRIGPFLFEGQQIFAVLGVTAIIWLLMIWGLIRRRPWGRVFALFVFAGHVVLLIAGSLLWLSAWNHSVAAGLVNKAFATPGVIFRIMVWPTLRLLVPSALAFAYVAKRSDLFRGTSSTAAVA